MRPPKVGVDLVGTSIAAGLLPHYTTYPTGSQARVLPGPLKRDDFCLTLKSIYTPSFKGITFTHLTQKGGMQAISKTIIAVFVY